MRKTYTFAEDKAPAKAHMAGLLSGLKQWLGDCERRISESKTQKDLNYWRGKRDAFREVISTIEDSNSI